MAVPTEHQLLSATPLFAGIGEEAWEEVLACCLQVELGPGEPVFVEGEPAEAFFVITSGSVRVSTDGPQGEITLAELGSGSVLGEMSLLLGGEHSASVHTLEATTLLRFPHAQFSAWLEGHSSAACRVSINLARTLAARLRAADALLKELAGRASQGNQAEVSDLNRLRQTFFTEWG